MNPQSCRRARGFTLVELLVVITIIAVLAAVGGGAYNAAIQKAKKTTALATCIALESAVNNFFTDNGCMPTDATEDITVKTGSDKQPAEGAAKELLTVLLGLNEASVPPKNTRGVKYLTAKEGKAWKNGLIYSTDGSSITGLYDPWGGGYYVRMDCDLDEMVTPDTQPVTSPVLHGRRAASWSYGADGIKGSNVKATDDVKTW